MIGSDKGLSKHDNAMLAKLDANLVHLIGPSSSYLDIDRHRIADKILTQGDLRGISQYTWTFMIVKWII